MRAKHADPESRTRVTRVRIPGSRERVRHDDLYFPYCWNSNRNDPGFMIHDVTIPAALIAGLISFLSPCVLPLVPPYLIYLTGATIEHVNSDESTAAAKRAVMISALMFVLGFSTVFVALGASASLIGGLIRAWSAELSIVAGIVIIIMGLHFLGLTRIGLLMREG